MAAAVAMLRRILIGALGTGVEKRSEPFLIVAVAFGKACVGVEVEGRRKIKHLANVVNGISATQKGSFHARFRYISTSFLEGKTEKEKQERTMQKHRRTGRKEGDGCNHGAL